MGFVTRFFVKPAKPALVQLPTGSFTMDREGHIMTSTMPQSFSAAHAQEVGDQVLAAFRSARRAQMPLSELIVQYSALKLLARELRGGAIVFLMPQTSMAQRASGPGAKLKAVSP
jgi:hypothetical protein